MRLLAGVPCLLARLLRMPYSTRSAITTISAAAFVATMVTLAGIYLFH